jgi:hypothetical protein
VPSIGQDSRNSAFFNPSEPTGPGLLGTKNGKFTDEVTFQTKYPMPYPLSQNMKLRTIFTILSAGIGLAQSSTIPVQAGNDANLYEKLSP